ncbi:MAG: two-component sensor histidine kinase [Pyrinomonadaceae bacterium]|nr:two-component sensor histidine kinase [Phycisphaerales bacterium]
MAFAIGVLAGIALTTCVAWFVLRPHLRRSRAAEQRASSAERMAEIGAMTGGLAHEIKNPLSTIGLNAQLLAESIQDLEIPDPERMRLLNRMKALGREVERLRGILTDFLEFAGKVHLEPRPTDLHSLLPELIDFYTPEAERHGVRIRAEFCAGPLVASVDEKLLKQALLNLMLNATQAMAARAEVSRDSAGFQPAAASTRRAGDLILRTSRAKDAGGPLAHVDVIDTGPGMSEEVLGKIFQPYFTTKSGGTGLGLPAARRLIEEHGGTLRVHSEVGQGTAFTVALPLLEQEP